MALNRVEYLTYIFFLFCLLVFVFASLKIKFVRKCILEQFGFPFKGKEVFSTLKKNSSSCVYA